MIQPASALLSSVARFLPTRLVSQASRRALRQRAASVPGAWASACVECRLVPGEGRCDLLVYASEGDGGQRALSQTLKHGGGAEFGRSRPFLEAWSRRGSSLGKQAAAVWLEYDLPDDGVPPDPFVFVCLYPGYLSNGYPVHQPKGPQSPKKTRALAALGLRQALGKEVSAAQLALIERCTAQLPATGRLLHVVGMPDRPGNALRVGAIVPASKLRDWLERIDWQGSRQQVDRLLRAVGDDHDYLHAQVELTDRVEPRLALDFNLAQRPSQSRQWADFADRVVSDCGCEKEKVHAALGWVRSRRLRFPGERWIARIDHQLFFKVSSAPDRFETKAYLCFQPRYSLL
jgi:hypothetical protein